MGQSTDGQICYGIAFGEDMEFPWDADGYDSDPEDWWLFAILGFRQSFELYTPEGRYIGGVRPPREKVTEYYNERRGFMDANLPLPVILVNHCSGDYPMYILAVPGTFRSAARGSPGAFVPSELEVTEQQKAALIKFCKDYGIEFDGEPAWYLSSYWG